MTRIDLPHLCYVLEELAADNVVNRVKVEAETRMWSIVALDRMLALRGDGNAVGKNPAALPRRWIDLLCCGPIVAAKHPIKHVRAAIAYAESRGWTLCQGRRQCPRIRHLTLPPPLRRDGHSIQRVYVHAAEPGELMQRS